MFRIRTVLAALMVVTIAGSSVTSADAAGLPPGDRVVVSWDKGGDVRLLKGPRLDRREKRSIDIRRVKVERVGNRARISIRYKETIRTRRFDQMFFVSMKTIALDPADRWTAGAGFTTKGRYGYADYSSYDFEETVNCGLKVVVQPARNQVVATIPAACTPRGPVQIRVSSLTGFFRTDMRAWSWDDHVIPGRHIVVPAVA